MTARTAHGPAGTWLATFRTEGGKRLEVSAGPGSPHSIASEGASTVLFDGVLYTRRDWLRDFSLPKEASDASLVLNAYLRWGEGVLDRIRGLFAVIVWDGGKELLLCARDAHGMHPFFYADAAGELLFSTSTDALARHRGVAGTVDRVAIADLVCHRWPGFESTFYEGIRRLPGGYAMRARNGSRTVERYWDPIPPGKPIDYLSEEEAGGFTDLLDQAIERCLPGGPAAIYLSGGLDSVSIAAMAQEQLGKEDAGPLLALSLVFEHPAANEEVTQQAVAASLGLPQKIVTISDAIGPSGLLASAMEASATRSAPLMNLWSPAYAYLSRYAVDRGCEVILTGNGGDEWLEAGVHNAGIALRSLDFVSLYQLWSCMQRSYPQSRRDVARNLLWTFGMRPILRQGAASTLERTAPDVLARQERWRFEQTTPAWIAGDPWLREQMLQRYRIRKRTRSRGALDSPLVAFELEEFYESGRQAGVRLAHPFWDADLTAFLMRVPPRLLMRDGYSKGLVRQSLSQKFPGLGFGRHRKLVANDFYRSVLIAEGIDAWRNMGGAQALVELGVVDRVELDRFMDGLLRQDGSGSSGGDPNKAYQVWYVLSIEAWLRGRLGHPAVRGA